MDEMLPASNAPFALFKAFGVELEYMVVDAETLDVLPITDRILHEVAGDYVSEVERGKIAWSNELALHVIELKTNGPSSTLQPLADQFQLQIGQINALLQPMNARLMPTAMHPWMDPDRELKLWPHQYNPVYEAYNRIFDCRGHGWANLQSVHLNLPFSGDAEFGRLHSAVRLLLPILPAIAASSPVVDGRITPFADNRMEVYRHNSDRVRSVTGDVIPESVSTRAEYERVILNPMYDEIGVLDPDGILHQEWLNARGAIARFDRNTIEIRVMDVQECPAADLAICSLAVEVLRSLCEQRWTETASQRSLSVGLLAKLLLRTIRDAEQAVIDEPTYLAHFGLPEKSISAQELWHHLAERSGLSREAGTPLHTLLRAGPLSRRIVHALGGDTSRLQEIYRELSDCLARGVMYT